ncbi:MAG: hypothetical protein AAGI01_04140, partial [Myxococcota bacterium]
RLKGDPPSRASASIPKLSELPEDMWRGVCFAHNWQWMGRKGYGTDSSAETLDHLKALGTNWVSLTPFAFMRSLESVEIQGEHKKSVFPPGSETAERIKKVAAQAHARGLKIMLKPHIWVSRGQWRGKISPKEHGAPAWGAWWEEYDAFILWQAKLAQDIDAESFVVGVELASALKANPDRFLETVKKVRAVYSGKLTYSANWDEYQSAKIWNALDMIGVQLYPPLSAKTDPEIAELRRALRTHLDKWSAIARKAGRSIVLTEVGYKSAPTAVKEPFGWPERLPKELRTSDQKIQAVAYAALFEEIRAHDEIVRGLFIWKYFTDKNTDEEGPFGFSPRGKMAERVLRDAFGGALPNPKKKKRSAR